MSRNEGRFISRETSTYWNGDKAVTDTFQLNDGTLVFHIYNVTADGRAHSHQVIDEYGITHYCREIIEHPDHPWIELDRMNAERWLTTLSQDKLNIILDLMSLQELRSVSNMIHTTEPEKAKVVRQKSKKLCK